jgi:hypothetical protein
VGERVSGGEDLAAGFDLDGAVALCGAYEFLDAPTGLVLDPVADGQRGEDDREVGFDRFAGVVVDRLCRGSGYADE